MTLPNFFRLILKKDVLTESLFSFRSLYCSLVLSVGIEGEWKLGYSHMSVTYQSNAK